MGIKNYFTAGLILIGIISTYTYNLNLGSYTFIMDIHILSIYFEQTLPIYIWIVVPTFVLFLATIVHLFYYSSKAFFCKQALASDAKTINTYVEDRLLNKQSNKRLKTKEFKELGNILNNLDIDVINNDFKSNNDSLNLTVEKVSDIKANNYVSIKSLKLDEKNPLEKHNLINRINKDSNFALEVLKQSSKYDETIVKIAFNNAIDNKPFDRIKKLVDELSMDADMTLNILSKDLKLKPEERFTNSEILDLIQKNKLSNTDLIKLAREYKKRIEQPDQLIKLFEDIAAFDETLTESYLYVLFQYEMLSQIKEILENSQKNEYLIYKALMDLKDAGKHYTVENLTL
jgi:hypothetical protein